MACVYLPLLWLGNKELWQVNQVDAVYRAWGNAEVATRALLANYRVCVFGGADNRVDRTGLNTLGASDALALPNDSHLPVFRCFAVGRVEG